MSENRVYQKLCCNKSLAHFEAIKIFVYFMFVSSLSKCYKNRFGDLFFAVIIVRSFGSGLRRNFIYRVASILYKSMMHSHGRSTRVPAVAAFVLITPRLLFLRLKISLITYYQSPDDGYCRDGNSRLRGKGWLDICFENITSDLC